MTDQDDDFITGDEFDPEVAAAADDKRYEAKTDNEDKIDVIWRRVAALEHRAVR